MCGLKQDEINKLYREAVRKWGVASQLNMLTEEASEVIDIVCKFRRGRCHSNRILEELVDLQIMLDQIRLVFDDDADSKWDDMFNYKLMRLKVLIEDDTTN